MSSIQERLQLKRVPLDTWNIREQLCLASAVVRSGDQNWMSVSRAIKTVGEPNRPQDWYSQKSCAAQYGALLEHVETPKRKKRSSESAVETPQESILKRLTQERIVEIQKTLAEMNQQYEQLTSELTEVRNPSTSEDRLRDLWNNVEAAKRARERESATRAAWLKEREERRARAERTWRPPSGSQTSPAGNVTPPTPSSPLLTSLLKSSPVVTTPQHISHPANVVDTMSPSAGAPTLSMLLEKAGTTTTTTTTAGHESKHAAIEHIKSQLVQIEHQLKASTTPPTPSPLPTPAPSVDIDDIEIKAEDVYAFRDIDIHIPPVAAMHKANNRPAEKGPFKKDETTEDEPMVEATTVDIIKDIKEEPVISEPESGVEEPPNITPPETQEAPVVEEVAQEPEPEPVAEVKISFPEVKFPNPEIKVIQPDEQKIKEEVKEPEAIAAPEPETQPEPEPVKLEVINEEINVEVKQVEPEPAVEPQQEVIEKPEEAIDEVQEPVITEPEVAPEPEPEEPEIPPKTDDVPETPSEVEPEVVQEEVKEELPEIEVPEEKEKENEKSEEILDTEEDIKKDDDAEDSIPLKEMVKDEGVGQSDVKLEAQTEIEDTHTETDDDTPMELSREEEKDGKKKRDYSRKKKSDSRTCSGSESAAEASAPDSPSANDSERQHRLWKKSVMLVYSRLCAHKYASIFLRPISDEEAPGYSVVVKRPMDLTTIRRNIEAGQVRTTAEFQRDVMLMLSNALMYNSSNHSVYTMAKEMHEEAQCQLGMLLAAQAHAGLCEAPSARRKRRRADSPLLPNIGITKRHH